MDKDQLINSANSLPKVDQQAIDEYIQKADLLIDSVNQEMLGYTNLTEIIGKDNIDMMKNNHRNHLDFISSIMNNFNSNVMVETILWVFKTYKNHGFHPDYWKMQLTAWINALQKHLNPGSHQEIIPIYNWLRSNIESFSLLSD